MSLAPFAPDGTRLVRRDLVEHLVSHGSRPALLTTDERVTYEDLATRVAHARRRLGVARRLVVLPMDSSVEALVWYLAALAGRHPVLLTDSRSATLEAMTRTYDPDVVLRPGAAHDLQERRPGTAHELHPDLALLLSTSGSTGSPKLVRLSRRNLLANAASIAAFLDVRGDDVAITTLPVHYCYGLSVLHTHLLRGASVVLTSSSVVDGDFWELVSRHSVTSMAGVPYTFELLDRVGFAEMDLPHLRYVTQAGGRMAPERVRAYAELGQRRGWDLFVMYGQTEATARMAYLPPEQARRSPHAIGIPIPGGAFELEPVDGIDDGTGELVYTGPNVMMGYATSPADLALGAEVSRLRTGDLARRTADGLYVVVGRRSRFAKVFGLRIDLDLLEARLGAAGWPGHCAEADGAVVVAVDASADASRVREAAMEASGLPASALRVVPVDEVPRLASGKPDYASIRLLAAPAQGVQPQGTSVADLAALFADVLDRDDVRPADTFLSLGGDSLSYVELSLRLEDALGELPVDWHTATITDLAGRAPVAESRFRLVDTTVLLRAVSILLIVGTHAGLFVIKGGAHVLLAVAGYNLARFHLTGAAAGERARRLVRSATRIAVPSVVWIGTAYVATDLYRPENVLLLHTFLGPEKFGTSWAFWFIEVLVWTVLALALLLRLPAVHRLQQRAPFGFAAALVALGLLTRFDVVTLDTGPDRIHMPHLVFWFIALGWAAAEATRTWQRVAVSVVALAAVPGFFTSELRTGLVIAGILLLVWVRAVPVPRLLVPLAGVLAASSLYIYLTHFPVYRLFDSPLVGVVASLVVGVLYWQLAVRVPAWWRAVPRALRSRAAPASRRAPSAD